MEAPTQTSPPASETGSYDGLLQTVAALQVRARARA